MPREPKFPRYPSKKHSSGQARIVIDGKAAYLGVHDSTASHTEYARRRAEWEARRVAGVPVAPPPRAPKTVIDLLARFWSHAETKYRLPTGEPSSELANLRYALRPVALFWGHLPIGEFGPLALKEVRKLYVKGWTDPEHGPRKPQTRKAVQRNLNRVRVVFAWGESEELVPGGVTHRLRTVKGLDVGELGVAEPDDVLPVPDVDRRRSVRRLNPVVADMVRVQYLSGARPGEICALRPRDIVRADALDLGGGVRLDLAGVWAVLPPWHKTRRKGHRRVILLGPKAQAVLKPYLEGRDPNTCVFSPAEAREARYAAMRASRKTPVQPSQEDRRKATPKRRPRERYTVNLYDQAIARVCENHGIRHWSAHQLRHSAACVLCEQFGPEITRIVLGHRTLDATRIYLADNLAKALAAMREVG